MNNPHGNKVIVFNGPKDSGKTTLTNELLKVFPGEMREQQLSTPIKHAAHDALNLFAHVNSYEGHKDEPHEDFFGAKPRNVYIAVSNAIIGCCGVAVFGHLFVREYHNLWNTASAPVTITECGMLDEIKPLIEYFGADNVIVIRLMREGYTFEGDSRAYMNEVGCISAGVGVMENDIPGTLTEVLKILEQTNVLASI